MPKITEMYCFALNDKDEDDEGVPAFRSGFMALPLMGADLARVESLMPIAQKLADDHGKPIRIYKFSVKEQIGEIHPRKMPLTGPPVVHGLEGGFALCLFSSTLPIDWPDGHVWVDPRTAAGSISCQKCRERL